MHCRSRDLSTRILNYGRCGKRSDWDQDPGTGIRRPLLPESSSGSLASRSFRQWTFASRGRRGTRAECLHVQMVVRLAGVEPAPSPWKGEVLAVIRQAQRAARRSAATRSKATQTNGNPGRMWTAKRVLCTFRRTSRYTRPGVTWREPATGPDPCTGSSLLKDPVRERRLSVFPSCAR